MESHYADHDKRKQKKPVLKIVLLSLILLILAGAGIGWWYWNTHKETIIKDKLEKAIASKSKGVYKVTYDSLALDEVAGWLKVYNMSLIFDSNRARVDSLIPPLLFSISIPEINVTGVKTPRALIDNEIIANKLEILNPVVDIHYTYKGKDAARNAPTKEVYQQILGNLNLIQVDTVTILNAQLQTLNRNTGKKIIEVENISLALTDVKVDSASYEENDRYLFAKKVLFNAGTVSWSSDDRLYKFNASGITASSFDNNITINSFKVIPVLGENAFVNAIPTQDDRFDFSFSGIRVSGVDINKLSDEYLDADSMHISNSSFKIYRDLARPRDQKNRIGYYPHQVLDDVPFHFNIRKIIIPGSYVEYKERNHITRESGVVKFQDIYAVINNFTNDKKIVAPGQTMKASVQSRFLGQTPFNSEWTFYLFHPDGRFDVEGNLGELNATHLNLLTEPMGPATIKAGYINNLDFSLKGSDTGMNGFIKVLYQDLKVALLELDKGKTETDKKFLMSLLANIVIKNDNPKSGDEIRTATVNLPRDSNRSAFWMCWKTIFRGIRETVGIKK